MQIKVTNPLETYPEFLSSSDLVSLGLFGSPDLAYLARRKGNSPDYIKIGRKVLYPKPAVVEFIEQRLQKGSAAPTRVVTPEANHVETSPLSNRMS